MGEHGVELDAPRARKARVHAKAESAGDAEAGAADRHAEARPRAAETRLSVEDFEALFSGKGAAPAGPAAAKAAPASVANAFDRKAARKLKIGRADIEARIDLHGMRQHEAHAALKRFLKSSHAQGRRYVLVITGKGGPALRDDGDDRAVMGRAVMGREERGVLKRNVPGWLAEPDLAAIVVSFTRAAPQHGGEGALYIHLRSRERS